MQVEDVVDINMVCQGEPGYSNEDISFGDLILSVDGVDAQAVPLSELQDMLRGILPPISQACPGMRHHFELTYSSVKLLI